MNNFEALSQAFKYRTAAITEELLAMLFPKVSIFTSPDRTIKFLFKLQDGNQIESVLIPFNKKYTACLSSQVGCQVKCTFCFTGSLKNFRQLSPEEILGQYVAVVKHLRDKNPMAALPSIVFMGQGEPLQNFEAVKLVVHELMRESGLHLGPRQITLSTAGHLPGLKRFHELGGINLALSLHAANDKLRTELIPLNRLYNLAALKVCLIETIPLLKKRQFLMLEYLVLADVNDDQDAANELYDFCQGMPVILNLIPFNEYAGAIFRRPSEARVENFKQMLVEKRLRVMVRQTKGDEVSAACGQLANQEI